MAYSARALTTNILQNIVEYTNHGFPIGIILGWDGTTWFSSIANSDLNSQVVGMVSYVIDVNNFVITQVGFVSNLPDSYMAGDEYYLSPTNPGELTNVKPTTPGQYVVPLFIPYTLHTGYFAVTPATVVTSAPTGFPWTVVTTNTSMAINTGYIINGAGLLTMTLPASATPGDIVRIAGSSASGWSIVENTNQIIHFGINSTTVTSGSLSSSQRYDTVELINTVATNEWVVLSNQGNLTIV